MEDFFVISFLSLRFHIFAIVIPSMYTTSEIANEMYSTIYERALDKNI